MAYIDVIQHADAEGELLDIYDNLVQTRGKLAEVHKIQSLHPQSIVHHMDFYMTIMFGKSPLKRYQREMIAVVVSATNQCPYCVTHHGDALMHFWKDQDKVERLAEDFHFVNLNESDAALCNYAQQLTKRPNKVDESNHIESLKKAGCSDRAILDAALVTSYFNFVNRMVLGLGVHLEAEGGAGYNYD